MEHLRTPLTSGLRALVVLVFLIVLAHPVAAAPFAYIANSNSDTVSVIDVATRIVVATVPVGRGPSGVAASVPGTRVYVLNALDNTVSVIDAGTRAVIGTVRVGYSDGNAADSAVEELSGNAAGLAIDSQGKRVYVANAQNNTISVIDTSTNTVIGAPIIVGAHPLGVAVSPSGSYVYVTNSRSNTLSIVDTTMNLAIATLPVGLAPRGVAVHPSGRFVYVATADGLVILDLSAAIADPSAMPLVTTVPIAGAHGVAASADGRNVYVTSDDSNAVVAIDALTTLSSGAPIALADYGCAVNVTPDGRFVYVTNTRSDSVSIIDAATRTLVYAVNVGSGPAALGAFIGDVPPVAIAQFVSATENTVMPIVLAATDVEDDPLTFSVVTGPAHGTITGAAPNLVYTASTDYAGVDSFSFKANDGAADSNIATVSITVPFRTSITLTSSLNPSTFGQAVTFTATVTGGDETPRGTVQFFDGWTSLSMSKLNGGTASLTTSTMSAGTHSITAVYAPIGSYASSTSPVWWQTVVQATATSSLWVSSYTPQYSDVERFTATITPSIAGGPVPEKVSFKVGTQIVGEARLTPVGGSYQATWSGPLLEPLPYGTAPTGQMKPGPHVVTATFVDPNVAVSNPYRGIIIQKEDARVAYTGPTSVSFGGSATGTVRLSVSAKDITAVTGDPARDANPGDIQNAQVAFVDRATNTILGIVAVRLSDSDSGIGTASYDWPVNLGMAKSKTYTIGFLVTNYYYRNSTADNAVVVVTKQ
jgi:YVTN family beta-propeller protein